MKIMVVGGGGREHAIIKKLKMNSEAEKIYALPGNAGIQAMGDAECIDSIAATDIEGIMAVDIKRRMGNAPFIALSESRRAVRGGKRGEGPAGFPGKRASRAPRRKWRGGFPRYRKSRGPAVKPGQSGWYREAHLFVLEMTDALYN